jgi:hypothetical protein
MGTERWQIDSSHSGIQFTVRHLVIAKVRGQFSRWTGTLQAIGSDFVRGSPDVAIDASSIDTGARCSASAGQRSRALARVVHLRPPNNQQRTASITIPSAWSSEDRRF